MIELVDPHGNPQLDPAILPIFQKYKEDNNSWIPDFDFWSYLNLRADHDLAAAFSKLFWPDFIEVDGYVLLARRYDPENFRSWKEQLEGNRSALEGMINHVHIGDLFLNSPEEVRGSQQLSEYLANVLMVCWKHALLEAFPERHFVFSVERAQGFIGSFSFYQAQ